MEEVEPNFVMATLICFLEAQHAERDCEGSMRADLPFILGTWRIKEPTHIRPQVEQVQCNMQRDMGCDD